MNELKNSLSLDLAPESKLADSVESGVWTKLKRGLLMTHTEMLDRIEAAVSGRAVLDEAALEILEETLIAADLGVETSLDLVQRIRESADSANLIDSHALRERLVDEISVQLLDAPPVKRLPGTPIVTLLVGVNGVGKTTSAAKLAHLSRRRGEKVLLAAASIRSNISVWVVARGKKVLLETVDSITQEFFTL